MSYPPECRQLRQKLGFINKYEGEEELFVEGYAPDRAEGRRDAADRDQGVANHIGAHVAVRRPPSEQLRYRLRRIQQIVTTNPEALHEFIETDPDALELVGQARAVLQRVAELQRGVKEGRYPVV